VKPLPPELTNILGHNRSKRDPDSEFYDGIDLAINIVKAVGSHEARTQGEIDLVNFLVGAMQMIGGRPK
jgi:hypothetical protein